MPLKTTEPDSGKLNSVIKFSTLSVFLSLALFSCAPARAEYESPPLPLIEEDMDTVMFFTVDGLTDYQGNPSVRLAFIRDGKLIANRTFDANDFLLYPDGNGGWAISFQDFWTANRIIRFKNLWTRGLDIDPTQEGQNGQWWFQNRIMVDFVQP